MVILNLVCQLLELIIINNDLIVVMNSVESPKRKWYLVYCKARQEVSARVNLERQGYEVYLPMIYDRKSSKVGNEYSVSPLFPRYLFIHLAIGFDNWGPIRSTIGVSHFIKFGLEFAYIPNSLMAALASNVNSDGVFEAKQVDFKLGDKLRITEGVMEGYEGVVIARTGKERVKLMLNSVNSSMFNFEMSDGQLELLC